MTLRACTYWVDNMAKKVQVNGTYIELERIAVAASTSIHLDIFASHLAEFIVSGSFIVPHQSG